MNMPLTTSMLICGLTLSTLAAAQPAFADLDDATIEHAFWHCDVRSMQILLEPGDGIVCERLTDALQQRRFGGDFTRFLAWWQERKAVEHARHGLAPAADPAVALQAP